jgi:hypothetical protein
VIDDADIDDLLNALARTRAVDQTLHHLRARHQLSLRGFLLANGPTRPLQPAVSEQDLAEPQA